jgi:hypothetical protein
MLSLPLVAFVLVALSLRLRTPSAPRRDSVLRAVVLTAAFAVAWIEFTSAFDRLTPASLAIGWAGVLLVAAHQCYRHRARVEPLLFFGAGPTARVGRVHAQRATALLTIGAGVMGIGTLAVALIAAPGTYDSLTYRLARVAHWEAAATVGPYATSIARQLHLAPGAEYLVAHLYLLGGGDRWVNLVEWGAFVGCLVGVSLIAKELGARGVGQGLAAVFMGSLPMAVLQASSTQNDLVAALWVVATVVFGLRTLRGRSRSDAVLLALSLGLAAATKMTTVVFLAPFGVAWLVAMLRRGAIRPALLRVVMAAVAVGLLTGPHLIRVADVWGSPFGPAGEAGEGYTYLSDSFTASSMVSGVTRNLAIHLTTPWPDVNRRIYLSVLRLHSFIRADPAAPATTWTGLRFAMPDATRREDAAGAPALLAAFLLSLVALAGGRRWTPVALYCLCVVCGFFLFSVILKWQPWHGRLHLPLLVLAAGPVGAVLAPVLRPWGTIGVTALLALTVGAPLLGSTARPLVGPSAIQRTTRTDHYFLGLGDRRHAWETTAEMLGHSDCLDVGLGLGVDDPEYLLWALTPPSASRTFRHLGVPNPSRRFEVPAPPCTVVLSTASRPELAAELPQRGYVLERSIRELSIFRLPADAGDESIRDREPTLSPGNTLGPATSPTAAAPANAPITTAEAAPIGDRVHISGCDFGVLKAPVVDLWDGPKRTRVVGEVSGDGPSELGRHCLGAVVIIRSVDVDQPTPMYEVETVVGRQRGWLSEDFIGPTFDISLCGAFFSHSSAAAGKCRG